MDRLLAMPVVARLLRLLELITTEHSSHIVPLAAARTPRASLLQSQQQQRQRSMSPMGLGTPQPQPQSQRRMSDVSFAAHDTPTIVVQGPGAMSPPFVSLAAPTAARASNLSPQQQQQQPQQLLHVDSPSLLSLPVSTPTRRHRRTSCNSSMSFNVLDVAAAERLVRRRTQPSHNPLLALAAHHRAEAGAAATARAAPSAVFTSVCSNLFVF